MPITYWFLLSVGILSSAAGGIFLKLGSVEIEHTVLWKMIQQCLTNYKIGLGLLLYFLPSCIWIFMLKRMEISFLQPMFSLVYIVTPILAIFILNENIPISRWIGIGIIMIGVIVASAR